jgi:hypothetical protein
MLQPCILLSVPEPPITGAEVIPELLFSSCLRVSQKQPPSSPIEVYKVGEMDHQSMQPGIVGASDRQ